MHYGTRFDEINALEKEIEAKILSTFNILKHEVVGIANRQTVLKSRCDEFDRIMHLNDAIASVIPR